MLKKIKGTIIAVAGTAMLPTLAFAQGGLDTGESTAFIIASVAGVTAIVVAMVTLNAGPGVGKAAKRAFS